MFLKKTLIPFMVFMTITVSAQNNLNMNTDLASLSQTFVFSNFETNDSGDLLSSSGENPMNFMAADYAQSEELGKTLTKALFPKNRNRMEKTGRLLTYIGVPLAIIGGVMVAGADELSYNCVNGDCQGDARGGFGVVALAAGLGLSGTGAALWIIGSKK